jgi:hypothetical protein
MPSRSFVEALPTDFHTLIPSSTMSPVSTVHLLTDPFVGNSFLGSFPFKLTIANCLAICSHGFF